MWFSQRHGHTPVREVVQRESMDNDLRVGLWNAIETVCWDPANTPTEMHRWVPGFAGEGSPLDAAAVTERRDTFLRTALDQLPTRVR